MNEVLDNYIDTSFDSDYLQCKPKFAIYEANYRCYFPADLQARILDIGIGRGEMLSSVKMWGYSNSQGIDISPQVINHCKKLELPCCLVTDTDGWLREHLNEFSLITMLDVLEHIPKRRLVATLAAARKSLVEDGILIIQVPNLQSPDGYLHRYNDITHEVGFLEHSLEQVLRSAGFRNYLLQGLEEILGNGLSPLGKRFLRFIYYSHVRFRRHITANLNPRILTPVFFAVAKKSVN